MLNTSGNRIPRVGTGQVIVKTRQSSQEQRAGESQA
jgi:hypothetical protein